VSASPDDLKACCADAYSSDVVALLLGESYHPGGLALTRRLADALALRPGARVLDVACGRGTTALLLADAYGARVHGVDYSPANVAAATKRAASAGLADRVVFTAGDAEALPFGDAVFDAIVCECALCTFPDKLTAACEFARVLKPDGRVGITDVTARPDRLPAELTSLAARIACIADARTAEEYQATLAVPGLSTLRVERHDSALTGMIDQIEARLNVVRMTAPGKLEDAGFDPLAAPAVLAAARTAAMRRARLGSCRNASHVQNTASARWSA
jgi:SAM-dependent methyltransferase